MKKVDRAYDEEKRDGTHLRKYTSIQEDKHMLRGKNEKKRINQNLQSESKGKLKEEEQFK